jgi:DNA repair protein SbcD/Mre11
VKLLHTSDWHVGKTLRNRSRADEHEQVLAEIVALAAAEAVDLVLVTGDLFDTAAPAPDAERLVYRTLADLAGRRDGTGDGHAGGREVIVLAGNHDNARRLQAIEPLLRAAGVTTRATFLPPDDGGVVRFDARSTGEPVQVACIPFLSQRHVVKADELMGGDSATHVSSYDARLRALVAVLTAGFDERSVNIVAAHAFVVGGQPGAGERAAHVAVDYAVSATAFPATAHYVALGHLHRPQKIAAACPTWYAGSPLQLDFGDETDAKRALVVEARVATPARVREVPLTSGRPLKTLSGTLAQLGALAGTTGDAYLRLRVRERPAPGLADDLRALFPDAVDVVLERPDAPVVDETGPGRQGRSPRELLAGFLTARGSSDDAVLELFGTLLEELEELEDAGAAPSA